MVFEPVTPADLVDIERLKQLKARYFRLLDTKEWAEWGEVFTEDAQLRWGPAEGDVFEGREAIVAGVSRALEGATSCHHGHMPELEITGPGRARGIWAMFDLIESPAFSLRGYGHYREEYRKRDGRWHIHRTRLTRLYEQRTPR